MSDDVKGLKELTDKLVKLDSKLAKKTLKSAMMFATSPVVRQMKLAAPKGDTAHRTHKGRLVAPTFLSRSIARRGKVGRDGYELIIGVKSEAFYGVSFLDKGINVTSRKGKKIKPYKIKGSNWFNNNFIRNERLILNRFKSKLAERVEAAMR